MEIRNIKTFLQVVESGNFTKAAELLDYSQPTVSIHIKELEDELSCQLFDRIGHNIYLTEKGRLFLSHALSLNNSMESMREDFKSSETPSGEIRLASSDSLLEKFMLESYSSFAKAYPGIKLILSSGPTDDLIDRLSRNEADLIFTLDSKIREIDLVIEKESPVKLYFVASPKLAISNKKNVTIRDVLEYPLLLTESGLSYRKIFEDYLANEGLRVNPILETGRTDIIVKYVEKEMGISFLPDFTIEKAIRKKSLKVLNVKNFDLTIHKQLIYRKEKWLSHSFKILLEFLDQHEFSLVSPY